VFGFSRQDPGGLTTAAKGLSIGSHLPDQVNLKGGVCAPRALGASAPQRAVSARFALLGLRSNT